MQNHTSEKTAPAVAQDYIAPIVKAMRKFVQTAKRHSKTKAAERVRAEFRSNVQKVLADSIRLHEQGRLDDDSLVFMTKSIMEDFKTSRSCAYNRRMPDHALKGYEYSTLTKNLSPINETAREIRRAGYEYFDKVLGKDSPFDEPRKWTALIVTSNDERRAS